MATRVALITGVLGQDGSLLSEWLVSQGYRVVGVVRTPAQTRTPRPRVELVHADLCDPEEVRWLLDSCKPDEIYHLAAFHVSAQEGAGAQLEARRLMLATSFNITQTLAMSLLESGAKSHLVFAGSSQMYTATGAEDRVDETTPRQPSTFYGHAKSWAAQLLAQLRAEFGLRASTAILFNHESPRREARFVSRKITQAAAQIAAGRNTRLELANIQARVDWCSASDVVRALHAMASAREGRDYVIASGTLHSVEELLECAFRRCGLDWRAHVTFQSTRPEASLRGDPALIEATLGWRRSVSFEQLVQDMVDNDVKLLSAARRG